MKEKSLSVFLSFNGERGFFREFHISLSRFRYVLIGGTVFSLLLIAFVVNHKFFSPVQNQQHQRENKDLKLRLSTVLKEMEQLNSRLYQIEDFSRKVKVIAGLTPHPTTATGPWPGTSFPNSPLSQDQQISVLSTHFQPVAKSAKKSSVLPPSPEKGDYIQVYMDRLNQKSKMVQQSITSLLESLYEKQDIMLSTPTIMPAKGWISSPFGYRQYPFTGEVSLHEGIDIAGLPGSPVYAPGAGVVMFAGYKQGYGKVIVVDHGYQLSTLYGHLSDIMVSKWQKVKKGQVMGAIGNTGNSSGPHLHYEVRISNVPVDPAHYILNHSF